MMEGWVARVEFSDGPTAYLLPSGEWECDDALFRLALNARYSPFGGSAPASVMPFGVIAARRAAAELDGEATFAEQPGELEEGEVS